MILDYTKLMTEKDGYRDIVPPRLDPACGLCDWEPCKERCGDCPVYKGHVIGFGDPGLEPGTRLG